VSAAVAEASLVTDEHLLWPECVPVGAVRGRVGDPLTGCRVHQLADIWHASMLFPVLTWRIGNPPVLKVESGFPVIT
jgi:hypothetical protein